MDNNLIESAKSQIGKSEEVKQNKQDSSGFINLVFHNLKLIFPAWRQNFKTEKEYNATKELWLDTLVEEGITTPDQIERAIKAAKLSDSAFFPSIGQFIKWTQKEKPRVNEQAYQQYQHQLAEHTSEEYKQYGKDGMAKLRKSLK